MLNAFLTPPLVHFDSRWRDHLNAISLRRVTLDVALFYLLLFVLLTYIFYIFFIYFFIVFIHYLLLICYFF